MAPERTVTALADGLRQAVDRAGDGAAVLRLRVTPGRPAEEAVRRVRDWAAEHGHPFLRPAFGTAAPTAFDATRALLRDLLPAAEAELSRAADPHRQPAPVSGGTSLNGLGDGLAAFGPELTALLPELRSRPELAGAPPLTAIALGGTKRRLHRDSERLFRLVSAATSVCCLGLSGLARRAGRPPVIVIDPVELCDRYTLACLLHICRVTEGPGPVLVLVAAPAQSDRPHWPIPGPAGPPGSRWTGAETEQGQLVTRLLEATAAVDVLLPAGDVAVPDAEPSDASLAVALLGDPALAALLTGEPAPEDAGRCLDPVYRRAVLSRAPAGRLRALAAGLAGRMPAPDTATPDGAEGRELVRAWLEVIGGDPAAGTRRALRLIQQSYGFTLNYELILLACRLVLAGETAGGRAPALLFAALTHAYLNNQDLAGEIFDATYRDSEVPEVRAQICYYQGLIASKRRNRLAEGGQWFARGFAELAGRQTTAALLESGWLSNGMAMVAWREGRYDDAEQLVRTAIGNVEPYSDAQLVNLRVNLTNNLSVLLETRGEYDEALAVWRTLAGWSGYITGGSFTKSYRYREAWLLLRAGKVADAYECAVDSLAVARRFRDVFHMNIISRACAYLACRMGDHPAAVRWETANLDLMRELGHRPGQAHAYGQLAHVRYQAGDRAGAEEALRAAARCGADGGADALLRTALSGVAAESGPVTALGPDDDLYGLAMDRPKAKLTTPFSLAHLVGTDGYAADTHERALTTVRTPRS